MTRDKLLEIWYNLPSVSEVEMDRIMIPIMPEFSWDAPPLDILPEFDSVTFRKIYVSGLAVGWELE